MKPIRGPKVASATSPSAEAKPRLTVPKALRFVRRAYSLLWAASRKTLLATTAVQLVSGAGIAFVILVGRRTLASVLSAPTLGRGLQAAAPQIAALVVIMAFMTFASGIHAGIHRLLTERTIRYCNLRILEVAGTVDLELFEQASFYDRLQRARQQAFTMPMQVALGLPGLTGNLLTVAGLTVALVAIEPVLVPVIFVAAIPLWIVSFRNRESMYSFSFGQTPNDRAMNHISAILSEKSSAPEVRAFGTADYLMKEWDDRYAGRLGEISDIVGKFLRRSVAATAVSTAIGVAAFGGVVLLLIQGRIDAAGAAAAFFAMYQLRAALQGVGLSSAHLYEAALFLEDLDGFLEIERKSSALDREIPKPFARLEVLECTFSYPGSERPALVDVNLKIGGAEVVALVGENGSGKTTLAKILCKLYEPSSGRILWDGIDTADDPELWRRGIAVIFQDFVRYRLTAEQNIALGDVSRNFGRDEVEEAARRAGAHEFIEGLANGYQTILAKEFEAGTDLSVGQWQRMALARAFFRDSNFIVLDEPTASLDARAEYELFEKIRELAKGRSVLLISHRFSSVRSADRIYVLHAGRMEETGTHSELMALGGRYAEMFTLQASRYLDEEKSESN